MNRRTAHNSPLTVSNKILANSGRDFLRLKVKMMA